MNENTLGAGENIGNGVLDPSGGSELEHAEDWDSRRSLYEGGSLLSDHKTRKEELKSGVEKPSSKIGEGGEREVREEREETRSMESDGEHARDPFAGLDEAILALERFQRAMGGVGRR